MAGGNTGKDLDGKAGRRSGLPPLSLPPLSLAPRIEGLSGVPIPLLDLLDEIPLGLVILDRNRSVLAANRPFEALTGFSRETITGLPCRLVLRTNLCGRFCPALQAQNASSAVSLEGDMIDCQRRKLDIRITATALRDNNGDLCGFMETIQEIRTMTQDSTGMNKSGFFARVLGQSPKMTEVFNILPAVAQTDSAVLITGETGTGKDLVAEVIHEASTRSRGPFIKVNCGALPETLLESELFGHTKGAFTGAVSDKPGRLKMAHGGTLFLTEIGDLPLPLQVKLLTFLDDQIVYPLGASRGFQADVRVIAATHRQLENMVNQGAFRQDLLFRLNVIRVHLPPLRERTGDVKLLLAHYLTEFSQRFRKRVTGFTPEATRLLNAYAYPGNVREIRNIVEYAVGIVRGDVIGVEHLSAYLFDTSVEKTVPAPSGEAHTGGRSPLAQAVQAAGDTMSWPVLERTMILEALVQSKGRRTKAAEVLGWGRSTLWRKMKQYGLES
ncbi:MAG: sigma 54-interacting transcriptional regulator [Desulfobacterales bacterium]|nr:sigma 54-interacting transcriptional regulator [Desulfobacterales bacterium]